MTALAAGVGDLVGKYAAYGPLAASFLANLLGTFGDKGQLVVVMLATRYDAKRVFGGAMVAFVGWSALEVAVGQWIHRTLPKSAMTLLTGGLFLAFGLWTLRTAVASFETVDRGAARPSLTGGGLDDGLSRRLLPDPVCDHLGAHGGFLTAFVFIGFAEFGDKTQLLTINLAATFPDAPVAVFAGVVAALGLRTGVDALVGEEVERSLPTAWLELAGAGIFLAFGLVVLGVAPEVLLYVVGGLAALAVAVGYLRVRVR